MTECVHSLHPDAYPARHSEPPRDLRHQYRIAVVRDEAWQQQCGWAWIEEKKFVRRA
jgi:hypothetical protein